jgi:hypothetical protein
LTGLADLDVRLNRPKNGGRVLEVRLWSFARRLRCSATSKSELSPSSIVTEKKVRADASREAARKLASDEPGAVHEAVHLDYRNTTHFITTDA